LISSRNGENKGSVVEKMKVAVSDGVKSCLVREREIKQVPSGHPLTRVDIVEVSGLQCAQNFSKEPARLLPELDGSHPPMACGRPRRRLQAEHEKKPRHSALIAIVAACMSTLEAKAIDVCCPIQRIVVTLASPKRRVAIVSIGHQMQRRIALGLAITPQLAHSMLHFLGVSGA
jgi:hypothetical protein